MSYNEFLPEAFNPYALAKGIALRMKDRRLAIGLTQRALAERSGVSLGSVKRFETRYEISLKHLLKLAVVLDDTEGFSSLFLGEHYHTIDDVLKASATKKRQRGRRSG